LKKDDTVLRLRAEIADIEPPIWREFEIPASLTLARLHRVLQALMGWHDAHLWCFEAGGRRFEHPDPDFSSPGRASEDPGKVRAMDVLPRKGAALQYIYDFGDDWLVDLRVLDFGSPAAGARYPRCIAGARRGPLEDSGGPPGYEQLLEAWRNPKQKDARELLKWAGKGWDPEAFDLAAANKALAGLPAPRRLQ
jgi:hypothetical protein